MDELHSADLASEAFSPDIKGHKSHMFWLVGLLFFAYGLRIFMLDEQSIWWDEGISLHLAVSPIVEILADRLNNIHPPLYFVLLKGWLSLSGVAAFTARYLSVLASWLQVPVIFVVARRWFGWRTAVAAVLLATFSAVSIIYAQEIRAYALLALIYLLLLALTQELTMLPRAEDKPGTKLWAALGLTTWFGLHLHYIVLFVAVYISAWALLVFMRQRRWSDFRKWLLVLFLVGAASLPWLFGIWRNWTSVRGEAFAGTFGSEPAPLYFLLSQVWTFHLTGLAGSLARPGVGLLVGMTGVLLVLLILIRLGQKGTRRSTAILLAHWLIPLSSALVVWTIRSFSHPRYVSIFVPGLLLLAAYVSFPPKKRPGEKLKWPMKFLSTTLFLAIILTSLAGLWLYFFVPDIAKDDMRGVARYLEAKIEASDLILIPDTDWSLPFEYRGDATVSMPGLDDPENKWSRLIALSPGNRRVFSVDYQNGTRDWQGLLPFALDKAGLMVSQVEFDGLVVRSYILDEEISEPEMRPEQAEFGPIELTGSWVEENGFAGSQITVALRWQLSELMDQDAQVSIRVLDETNWPMATKDSKLIDGHGRYSQQWPVDEAIVTYHVIAIPPGVPPVDYNLEVQIYAANELELETLSILDGQGAPQGQTYNIGETRIAYDQEIQTNAQDDLALLTWPEPVEMANGLDLLSAELETGLLFPGETLAIQLLWQATAEPLPDIRPEVAIIQGDQVLTVNRDDPVYGRYPIRLWSSGEQVFERRGLVVPLDASGVAKVVIRLGESEQLLGEVEIGAREHIFVQPTTDYTMDVSFEEIARLTGFDLETSTIADGEPIGLTLVWESLTDGSRIDYVVFTHLLAEDGGLIGQHDGRPANGDRPTTGWLTGEIIRDHHEIPSHEEGYQGEARIEVGFYDPISGERLTSSEGSDFMILPVVLTIEQP